MCTVSAPNITNFTSSLKSFNQSDVYSGVDNSTDFSGINLDLCSVSDDITTHNSTWTSLEQCDIYMENVQDYQSPALTGVHISLCVISFVVSLLNIVVFTRPHLRLVPLNVLLVAIESSNAIIALCYVTMCSLELMYAVPNFYSHVFSFLLFVNFVLWSAVGFTVWLTGIIGLFRLIAISCPLKSHVYLNRKRAVVAIAVLAFLCLASMATVFLVNGELVSKNFILCFRDNRTHSIQVTYYALSLGSPNAIYTIILFIAIAFFAVPLTFCVSVTIAMLCKIRSSMLESRAIQHGRRRETEVRRARTTVILIAMLLGYVFCYPAFYCTNFLFAIPFPLDYILEHLMFGVIVNIMSFWGYYYMGSNFRKTFRELYRSTFICIIGVFRRN